MTNEVRDYAEEEFDEVEVEPEHVHWAPWSSDVANTSMNYQFSPPVRPKDAARNRQVLPAQVKRGAR